MPEDCFGERVAERFDERYAYQAEPAVQVACFGNAAAHLEPKGCFVVEVLVPRLQRLPAGETFQPFAVGPTHLGFDEYDVAHQGLISHHYWIDGDKVEVFSPPFRYVWRRSST